MGRYKVVKTEETIWMIDTPGGPGRALDIADAGMYDSENEEDMALVQRQIRVYEVEEIDVIDAEIVDGD